MVELIAVTLILIACLVICIKKKMYLMSILLTLILLGLLYVVINLAIYLYQCQIHGL